jgi:tetratricopeptide (TPR) repeat protein
MSRRAAWPFVAGMLCLLPGAGCLAPLHSAGELFAPNGSTNTASAKPELSPASSAKANLKLAEVMEKNGHLADAAFHYEKARQSDPGLHIAGRLARLYDRLGNESRALAEYQRALKENPRDADVLASLGYFYYARGQWPEAEENLRHALSVNPRHQRAWVNLGLTLGEQGQYAESLDAFRRAVSEAEAHSNLAFVLTTQGKREEAKQEYRRALELEPNLVIARRALDKLERSMDPSGSSESPAEATQFRPARATEQQITKCE